MVKTTMSMELNEAIVIEAEWWMRHCHTFVQPLEEAATRLLEEHLLVIEWLVTQKMMMLTKWMQMQVQVVQNEGSEERKRHRQQHRQRLQLPRRQRKETEMKKEETW